MPQESSREIRKGLPVTSYFGRTWREHVEDESFGQGRVGDVHKEEAVNHSGGAGILLVRLHRQRRARTWLVRRGGPYWSERLRRIPGSHQCPKLIGGGATSRLPRRNVRGDILVLNLNRSVLEPRHGEMSGHDQAVAASNDRLLTRLPL
jgi:hypothetical protein